MSSVLPFHIALATLSVLAKGAVLLGLTAGLAWLLRNQAAAYRHATWTIGLGMALLLPLAEGGLPSWTHSWVEGLSADAAQVASATKATATEGAKNLAETRGAEQRPSDEGGVPRQNTSSPSASSPDGESRSGDSSLIFGATGWTDLMRVFLGIWALGATVVLGWTVLGVLQVHWRARRATTPGEEWAAPLRWAKRQAQAARAARLRLSDEVPVPLAFGVFRPVILLPASAREWSKQCRRAVLLHELAHLKRNDLLANLVGQLACAVHWMNPLVWYGATRLRFERERACDDHVMATGMAPTDYADHLVAVAREAQGAVSFQGALTMAAPSALKQRVESLLSDAVPTGTPSRTQMILLALPLLAATLVLGAARPVPSDAGGGSVAAVTVPVRTDTTSCDPARTSRPLPGGLPAAHVPAPRLGRRCAPQWQVRNCGRRGVGLVGRGPGGDHRDPQAGTAGGRKCPFAGARRRGRRYTSGEWPGRRRLRVVVDRLPAAGPALHFPRPGDLQR